MIRNYYSCMFCAPYTASIAIDNNFLNMPACTKMHVSFIYIYIYIYILYMQAIAEGFNSSLSA